METGTLYELKAKPGDVVSPVRDCLDLNSERQYIVHLYDGRPCIIDDVGGERTTPVVRMITRANPAQKSPVRTVTRKEIISGTYGKVSVSGVGKVWVRDCTTIAELRAAIATLTEIADALEDE